VIRLQKVVSLCKFEVLVELAVGTQPTAEKISFDVNSMRMVATQNDGVSSGYVFNQLGECGRAGRHNNGVIFMQHSSFFYDSYNNPNTLASALEDWGISRRNNNDRDLATLAYNSYGRYYAGNKSILFHEGIHATQQCISGSNIEWKMFYKVSVKFMSAHWERLAYYWGSYRLTYSYLKNPLMWKLD